MVGIGNADLRIRAAVQLAAQHEGEDPRDVGLPGQRGEVEQQPDVLGVRLGDADRPGEVRQLGVAPLGELDAALDGAHRVQILGDPRPVAGADLAPQPGQIVADGVEDAAVLAKLRPPLRRRAAFAEKPLEDDAGVVLHRQRRRRVAPRDGVHVDAAVAVLAVADEEVAVYRQLQRRQRRRSPELPGGDLVRGRPRPDVGPLGLLRVDAVEPRGRGPRMLSVAVAERLGLPLRQSAQHDHPLAERGEGLEGGRELERRRVRRRPRLHGHAVRQVDPPETTDRLRGAGRDAGQCGRHRIEHRERQRGADAAQERAPGQRLPRDDHESAFLSRNGALRTMPATSDENRYPSPSASRVMARTAGAS